jgi:hypothetical protein
MTPRSRTFARRLRVRAGRRSGESSGTFQSLELRRSVVVLTSGFDCRSRRAARGAERSRAMSSRKRRCLAFPFAGGEEASEARPGWQSPRVRVAGSRLRYRESGTERALVGGRHPGPGKSSPLTRRRWKRFWSHPEGVSASDGWGDMGCQRVIRTPRSRLRTPWRRCAARGTFDRRDHQERAALETRNRKVAGARTARGGKIERGSSEAVGATSTAPSLESYAGALAPSYVMRCARACRSPRESNVRQVLVSRIGCRSR